MALRNAGIPAGCINSAMSPDELREAYTDARYGAAFLNEIRQYEQTHREES